MVAGATLAAQTPEDAAQAVADSWLKLVDGGDYPASWDQAASALMGAIKPASWVEMAEAFAARSAGWCLAP